MSADDEYYQMAWATLQDKHGSLLAKRAELEADLNDVKNEIAHVEEILGHLSPLAGIAEEPGSITGLGITDAIRMTLRTVHHRMSAIEIKRNLTEKGFDFSSYTQPMASIYKILARLKDGREIDTEKEGYKTFYAWKHPATTEEDIPF